MEARWDAAGSGAASPLGRIDPRLKILTALAVIVLIVSDRGADLRTFALYFGLLTAALVAARVPALKILRRVAWASPFVLTAAALLPLSLSGESGGLFLPGPWRSALIVILKAYASVLALSLVVLTDRLDRLAGATRSLGLPAALGSVLALAARFLSVLGDEAARMKRARESRIPSRLRVAKTSFFGRAGAALFLRGWWRAQAVRAAMEARGFSGAFPLLEPTRLRLPDALTAAAFIAPFLAVRALLS